MRIVLVPLLGAVLLHPGAAGANECVYLEEQLTHYQQMAERADTLGSEMWEQRMEGQVSVLEEQARARCPHLVDEDDSAARAFLELLRLAGKAALTYFTFGAL